MFGSIFVIGVLFILAVAFLARYDKKLAGRIVYRTQEVGGFIMEHIFSFLGAILFTILFYMIAMPILIPITFGVAAILLHPIGVTLVFLSIFAGFVWEDIEPVRKKLKKASKS